MANPANIMIVARSIKKRMTKMFTIERIFTSFEFTGFFCSDRIKTIISMALNDAKTSIPKIYPSISFHKPE